MGDSTNSFWSVRQTTHVTLFFASHDNGGYSHRSHLIPLSKSARAPQGWCHRNAINHAHNQSHTMICTQCKLCNIGSAYHPQRGGWGTHTNMMKWQEVSCCCVTCCGLQRADSTRKSPVKAGGRYTCVCTGCWPGTQACMQTLVAAHDTSIYASLAHIHRGTHARLSTPPASTCKGDKHRAIQPTLPA